MSSTWRTSNWEVTDEEDKSNSEWEKISVAEASRATSPSEMEVNPFELEGIIGRLERELAEKQREVEEQKAMLDSYASRYNHLVGTCENLRGRLNGGEEQAARLRAELTRSRALHEGNMQVERQRNLELSKEISELGEDVHMQKILHSAVNGSRKPTHLEEGWIFEEDILSLLIRGEVRKTILTIQKDYSVIMEVKSHTTRPGKITATCSLHDCVGFLYKVDADDGRWKGDRQCLKLQYGELYVINLGYKIELGKSLVNALLNGTTTSADIRNICGGKRLRKQLDRLAGRDRPEEN